MRKRNFSHYLDSLFWFVMGFFPVICYLFSYLSHTYTPLSFDSFLPFVGVKVDQTLVYGCLLDIFGSGGILPLFDTPEVFSVLTWFINVQIIHLAVDALLFVPRIAHCFMDKFTEVK